MSLMKAKFVYDGTAKSPTVPSEMGKPKPGQLEGTPREQTAELCGRICYDSLGKGRTSFEYHKHIHEVGHYSVYEHTPFTVSFAMSDASTIQTYALACMNRPGVSARLTRGLEFRITANFRAIMEWDNAYNNIDIEALHVEKMIGNTLKKAAHSLAPQIVSHVPTQVVPFRIVEPETRHEKWVTLYTAGSRGYSHEMVRHGDNTAISQRSTRYVDESTSPWVTHPLLRDFLAQAEDASELKDQLVRAEEEAKKAYSEVVKAMLPWKKAALLEQNPNDKHAGVAARKQCRGAARGFLGNALYTEIMFSASVAQWRWMLTQRASQFADAEIREIFAREKESVYTALLESRFADEFRDFSVEKSPDGIGTVLIPK